MIEKYYEEELRYLYESGREFAKAHPDRAQYLNIDSVGDRDPYVERLFEGFAFLVGRIREKLEDTFPQLTEGLVNLLWPQFLQEIPALCIAQFEPRLGFLQESRILPERSEVMSSPVGPESVVCKFTTTHPVVINPITLNSINRQTDNMNNETISFIFGLDQKIDWSKYDFRNIRIFLHAELPTALMLHRILTTQTKKVEVQFDSDGPIYTLDDMNSITPGGIEHAESILPTNKKSFWGYDLLKEYFIFPEKFLFINFNGIDTLPAPKSTPATITYSITVGEQFPESQPFNVNTFKLNCCPIANIFSFDIDPFVNNRLRSEYRVLADITSKNSIFVHSTRSVTGVDKITGEKFNYEPMHTFKNIGNQKAKTYATRFIQSPAGNREMFITFGGSQLDKNELHEESVSINAWCTNGKVPRDYIREGDIASPGRGFPDYLRVKNITRPSSNFLPPKNDELLWIFQAHLAATQSSLASKDTLKKFLQLYNWSDQEGRVQRIESIIDVSSEPMETVYKGSVIRGIRFIVTIEDKSFKDIGDLHLFGLILSKFFSQYVGINSFCELQFIIKPSGKQLTWNQIEGKRCLI